MTYQAEISAPVIGSGLNNDGYRPDIEGYDLSWSDGTGIPASSFPPNPDGENIIIRCEQDVMDTIANDDSYFVHWAEIIDTPDEAQIIQAFRVNAIVEIPKNKIKELRKLLFRAIDIDEEPNGDDLYEIQFTATRAKIEIAKTIVDSYQLLSEEVVPALESEKMRDDDVTLSEWGELRSWCARNGFSQAQINEAIGESLQGQKNGQTAEDLRIWIRENSILNPPG